MHDPHEPGPYSGSRPLQHLEVAVRIAEGQYRSAAHKLVDTHRLAGFVIDEIDIRQAKKCRLAIQQLELGLDAAADHLFRRDTVDLLRPRAHELDAPAGNDVGFETVRPQVGKQLQHWLIHQVGIQPVEPRMLRCGDPIPDDSPRIPRWSCQREWP